jgi:hypothetical protein
MSQGSTAYASYVRIHEETGGPELPTWQMLSHVGRMAWEAAAQAVACSLIPTPFNSGSFEGDDVDDDDFDDEDLDID